MENDDTKRRATGICCFLTMEPGERTPTKIRREYGGPVPPAVCEHLCHRVMGCAAAGCWHPLDPMDAYGELWAELQLKASNLPPLESATPETYLCAAADKLLLRFRARRVLPLRREHRAVEDSERRAAQAAALRLPFAADTADEPEGEDAGYAAYAAACEGGESGAGNGAEERLPEEAPTPDGSAAERRRRAAERLEEILALSPDEIVRAFRAYVAADGNMLRAAAIAHVGKSRWYANWRRWLRRAREIAVRNGIERN